LTVELVRQTLPSEFWATRERWNLNPGAGAALRVSERRSVPLWARVPCEIHRKVRNWLPCYRLISILPVAVRIRRIHYVSQCKARRCTGRATVGAEKVKDAGRLISQIELCRRHCDLVVERELEISDRRREEID